MANYTYIVECSDGTFYTGWTNDMEKRLRAHNTGRGAKYTKTRNPVKLVHLEMFETKEAAMRREYEIKQLSRKEKVKLIAESAKRDEVSEVQTDLQKGDDNTLENLENR